MQISVIYLTVLGYTAVAVPLNGALLFWGEIVAVCMAANEFSSKVMVAVNAAASFSNTQYLYKSSFNRWEVKSSFQLLTFICHSFNYTFCHLYH